MNSIRPPARILAILAILFAPTAALSVPLTIVPPDELTLDGMPISKGTFNLTGLIAYSDGPGAIAGALVSTTILDPAVMADDIIKFATIGDTTPEELGMDLIPAGAEVLHLTGFFEATDPMLSPAAFEIIVGVLTLDNGGIAPVVDNFTYYLPLLTVEMFPQVTDVGMDLDRSSLGDNTDIFFAAGTTFTITNMDPGGGIKLDNDEDNPWWVVPDGATAPLFAFAPPPPGGMMPNCPPPTIITTQRHGSTTTRIIPGPCDPPPPTGLSEPGAGLLLAAGIGLLAGGAALQRRRRARIVLS